MTNNELDALEETALRHDAIVLQRSPGRYELGAPGSMSRLREALAESAVFRAFLDAAKEAGAAEIYWA